MKFTQGGKRRLSALIFCLLVPFTFVGCDSAASGGGRADLVFINGAEVT